MSESIRWRISAYKEMGKDNEAHCGPRFDTAGKPKGSNFRYDDCKHLEEILHEIRNSLVNKLPWECRHSHENSIAKLLESKLGRVTRNEVFNCICPQKVRLASPQCAHVHIEAGGGADPFGKEINKLIKYGILDSASWTKWFDTMDGSIKDRDAIVATEREIKDESQKRMPLPLIIADQDKDLSELKQKRDLMIGVIDKILSELEKE